MATDIQNQPPVTTGTAAKEPEGPIRKTPPTPEPVVEESEDKFEDKSSEQTKAEKEQKKAVEEQEEAMEILEPKADHKRWVIGCPPDMGGDETMHSVYIQKPLAYMPRMRFFALVAKTISNAIKAGAELDFGELEQLRGRRLTAQDFADVGSFMTLAMELIAYSPDFLLECYCIWLDVPAAEKQWAKAVMNQPWDPDRKKWGLKEDDGIEMIEIFIDQNYEDIRRFFTEKLPRLAKRVRQQEETRKDQESESVPSKPSKP